MIAEQYHTSRFPVTTNICDFLHPVGSMPKALGVPRYQVGERGPSSNGLKGYVTVKYSVYLIQPITTFSQSTNKKRQLPEVKSVGFWTVK